MRHLAIFAFSLFLMGAVPQKAPVAIADLDDPVGDVQPGTTSEGKRPPFDVVHLTLTSDGSNIVVAVTLAKPPSGTFASNVVRLYFDTDGKEATGVKAPFTDKPGFEYVAEVDACINYADGSSACVGGMSGDAKIRSRYGVASVSKFGADWANTTQVRSVFQAASVPLDGKIVRATIRYEDLGLKSGKVVRIVAREADGPYDATADFPDVLLKLK